MFMPKYVHSSWNPIFQKSEKVLENIQNNLVLKDLCPKEPTDIFKAFRTPIQKVKLIILGQDPYPNQEDATGIAFAVPNNRPVPFSLSVMINSICTMYPLEFKDIDRDLKFWEDQGILLLNTALTCQSQPNTHTQLWQPFILNTLYYLRSYKPDLIIYTLGSQAQATVAKVNEKLVNHYVAYHSAHPAATVHGTPFIGRWKEVDEELRTQDIYLSWGLPF